MKKLSWLLAVVIMMFVMMAPSFAAPLFGDVPEQHWARDAVADLAAKGLLEGYPDGTFKGDRAATRWEMAMVVQRLLAKNEQEHATFATKADLEALRNLVNSLRDELDALGVRVKNLEEKTAELDKRVTELERITFFGDLTSKVVIQSFGTGVSFPGNPIFASSVGTFTTVTNINVFPGPGAFPGILSFFPGTYDLVTGRPLTNGTGFTNRLNLGVKIKVSDEVDAGVNLAAYSATGDQFIDAYWGITAPYMSNPFCVTTTGGALTGESTNAPWTRLTLDKFWLHYKPSDMKLVIGAIENTNFDRMILVGAQNPGIEGGYLPFYGFKVTGQTHFISDMQWQVMHSKLISLSANYYPWLFGFNLDWKITDRGNVKVNFSRANEEPITQGVKIATGLDPNPGRWINWNNAGTQRPITINNVNTGATAVGRIGPQAVSNMGLSINYKFAGDLWRVVLEVASSTYSPNTASSYSKSGGAFRFGIGYTNTPGTLDLDVELISVDPFYDPFIMQSPAYQRWPNWNTFFGYYQLHDTDKYPNNRNGVRFMGEYRFSGGDGKINLKIGSLSQVKQSLGQQFGGDGNTPGFIDPVFPLTVGFPAAESIGGTVSNFGLGIAYKFSPSPLKADLKYDSYNYSRKTGLNIAANNIGLTYSGLRLGLAYPFNDKFTLRGGYDYAGLNGSFQSNLTNINSTMTAPYLGFDYDLSKNTKWSFDIRSYATTDSGARLLSPDSFGGLQLMSQFRISF